MPILRPNSILNIPAKYIQIRIRNYSDTEHGSCSITTEMESQDYSFKPDQIRIIKLQRGDVRFENTGRTELSIRYSKKPFLRILKDLIFPSHIFHFFWIKVKIN